MASHRLTRVLQDDSLTFRGIFIASFAVFLLVALLAQALTWHWRTWLPGAEAEKSMLGGVKAAVYTAMSHLT
jgi:light-harvesting complex 1 beta chain